jgi:hypothetical protein
LKFKQASKSLSIQLTSYPQEAEDYSEDASAAEEAQGQVGKLQKLV